MTEFKKGEVQNPSNRSYRATFAMFCLYRRCKRSESHDIKSHDRLMILKLIFGNFTKFSILIAPVQTPERWMILALWRFLLRIWRKTVKTRVL